ncbi:MAG: citramalate synthase [Actinomycetes bacterium]|jgi:2-isopropylmalate synthase|nr:citramalate synthase [Actinomycetes bacterium]
MAGTVLYDTTLRDGAQAQGISYSLEDRLRICARLIELGVPYIEGGFPASNPKEAAFFHAARALFAAQTPDNAPDNTPGKTGGSTSPRLVAFGTIQHSDGPACDDAGLRALLDSGAPVVCVVAKAWDRMVRETLRVGLERNLEMLTDSIRLLKDAGREVFVDLEHWFDGADVNRAAGIAGNADYARAVLTAAVDAGADAVVLCDTNGGTLPDVVAGAVADATTVLRALTGRLDGADAPGRSVMLGVHFHNDTGCAVANSLIAAGAGAQMVQGTVNGLGERAGNADLLVTAASLALKRGDTCLSPEQLEQITSVSRFVADVANVKIDVHHPYVGSAAFTCKAGLHASATARVPGAYEHIDPARVGNISRVLVSELAGRASLKLLGQDLHLDVDETTAAAVLEQVKQAEARGYSFEAADASLALLIEKQQGSYTPLFQLESFRVIAEKRASGAVATEATIKIHVGDERFVATGEGNGPINALDVALRQALLRFYPQLADIRLTDYKVRVLDESSGTDAITRVLITSAQADEGAADAVGDALPRNGWGTVGVSENIIEASWEALVQSIEYGLIHRA